MLGFAALAEVALAEVPGLAAAIVAAKKVGGWAGRRIPIERLREILKEQGNPWADELADVVEQAPAKRQEIIEPVVEKIVERAAAPADWSGVAVSLRAAVRATRTTAALRHAEIALSALRAEWEYDDEDAIALLVYG